MKKNFLTIILSVFSSVCLAMDEPPFIEPFNPSNEESLFLLFGDTNIDIFDISDDDTKNQITQLSNAEKLMYNNQKSYQSQQRKKRKLCNDILSPKRTKPIIKKSKKRIHSTDQKFHFQCHFCNAKIKASFLSNLKKYAKHHYQRLHPGHMDNGTIESEILPNISYPTKIRQISLVCREKNCDYSTNIYNHPENLTRNIRNHLIHFHQYNDNAEFRKMTLDYRKKNKICTLITNPYLE